MKWEKKGHIFKPNGEYRWMHTHTTPISVLVLKNKIRVFYSSRSVPDDRKNFISYISFIDLEINDPKKILCVHNKPLLELGEPGTFDEYGTMVAKHVIYKGKLFLYYMGWQRLSGKTAPYQVTLGLAVSDDDGLTFKKVSKGPVLGIDKVDPISIGNVFILIENGIWKMWYTSFTRWVFGGKKPTPEYNIKYAESNNGLDWNKHNIICINEDNRGGIATPSVIKSNGKYEMWYGYRPPFDSKGNVQGYQIGYATSADGKKWNRNDAQAGIKISSKGWDSQMICYPHVIELNNKRLMFYCGNGFGETGFGYATLNNQNEIK